MFLAYKLQTHHTLKTPIRHLQETPAPSTEAPLPTTAAPVPTTAAPAPTTAAPVPTTAAPDPTTSAPAPTSAAPAPTTVAPAPTTAPPTTAQPTTQKPTTEAPTTVIPSTPIPTTEKPTTQTPTTAKPTTQAPSTQAPTTVQPTTSSPTTVRPTTIEPTGNTTSVPPTVAPKTKIDHSSKISYKIGYEPEFTGILKYTWSNCESESNDYGLTCQFFKSKPSEKDYDVENYVSIDCEGNDVSVFNATDIYKLFAGCALLKLSHSDESKNVVEESFVITTSGIKVKTWEIVTIAGVGVVVLLLIICICYCCCKKGCCGCCKKNEDAIGVRPKKNKKSKHKKRDRGAYAPLV